MNSPFANVIIVNYKKGRRLLELVNSLKIQDVFKDLNVFILDNSCCASEKAILSNIAAEDNLKIFFSPRNVGYTRAVNYCADLICNDRPIILSSPDIILERPDCIRLLVDCINANDDIDVLACPQINDDNSHAEVARRFPSPLTLISRRVFGNRSDLDLILQQNTNRDCNVIDVDWVQSSFVAIKQSAWIRNKKLNENYFLFMADTEFCLRCWMAQKRVSINLSILGVRADGVRASKGGISKILLSRTMRIHILDAARYYISNGLGRKMVSLRNKDQPPRRRRKET